MSVHFLESELRTAYEEQARYYGQALAAAELLCPALHDGQSADDLLNQITALLGHVNEVEARIAEAKRCWHKAAHKPGQGLSELLLRVENLIQALRGRLCEAEDEANRRKASLAPRLDSLIRGQSMRRA
jgi:hypothetical protein